MTLTARLCALCAVCALMELLLSDARRRDSLRMIGGLLMLHLVVSGVRTLLMQLIHANGLRQICEILIG